MEVRHWPANVRHLHLLSMGIQRPLEPTCGRQIATLLSAPKASRPERTSQSAADGCRFAPAARYPHSALIFAMIVKDSVHGDENQSVIQRNEHDDQDSFEMLPAWSGWLEL